MHETLLNADDVQVMDGGAVVIRGPPRNGPPAERILALTNINAPRLARRGECSARNGGENRRFEKKRT